MDFDVNSHLTPEGLPVELSFDTSIIRVQSYQLNIFRISFFFSFFFFNFNKNVWNMSAINMNLLAKTPDLRDDQKFAAVSNISVKTTFVWKNKFKVYLLTVSVN